MILRSVLIALGLLLISTVFCGCSGTPPVTRGIDQGSFVPCPQSPNCVSTMAHDDPHRIAPINYTIPRDEARALMVQILSSLGNIRVIEVDGSYIWAECASNIMGFVDDLEIYLPESERIIHLRSASRKGYFDLEVNRKRVETIRGKFIQAGGADATGS